MLSDFNLSFDDFQEIKNQFKQRALEKRKERVRPGLDYKIIAGWNGLTLTGLCDAYQALQDSSILQFAKKNASFIKDNLVKSDRLHRFPDKPMEGFMEDYAAVIQAIH